MRRLPLLTDPSARAPLSDGFGRRYSYLRLSLTDRCDLACVYCMPKSGEDDHAARSEQLQPTEIGALVRALVPSGLRRVRLTGGEPLVRKDVVQIATRVGEELASVRGELVLTTNGTRLSELAKPLREAGVSGVNVSIDSLDPDRFARITRGGDLPRVLRGIEAARNAGMEIKLNTVVLRGQNDDELEALVRFAWGLGATPRFIELMPIGEGAKLPAATHVGSAEIARKMHSFLAPGVGAPIEGKGPARYLFARDGSGRRVGFISAVTDDFCASCNRIRITARGDVRACLASRRAVSLRDLIRGGAPDHAIASAVGRALGDKLDGHLFREKNADEHRLVAMSLVGG